MLDFDTTNCKTSRRREGQDGGEGKQGEAGEEYAEGSQEADSRFWHNKL